MAGSKKEGLALQKEYAQKRQRALNKRDEDKIAKVMERISVWAKTRGIRLSTLARPDKAGWEVVYERIIRNMQDAQLTINLDADSWFAKDNQFATYATTYQRNVTSAGGKQVLPSSYNKKGDVFEPANVRLSADDKVTLPASWQKKSILHPQRARLYKAMSATEGKAHNKLTKTAVGGKDAYEIVNPNFNMHAKQVFAALNYGRRVHGSTTEYGFSYIVLKPELKPDAIYFPGDTFGVAVSTGGTATPTDKQCTYHTLGAILAYCPDEMAADIFQGCYDGLVCGETRSAKHLLEAHIFKEVILARHTEEIVLSRRTKDGDIPADVWATVKVNARDWARRNNCRLVMLSA